jgi:hypothetical protein
MNLQWLSELLLRVDWLVIGLWSGLVVLSIELSFLLWTRWGKYHLISKCVLFSVLAHLLSGLFFATAEVVGTVSTALSPTDAPERIEVVITDEDPLLDFTASGRPEGLPSGMWDRPSNPVMIESVAVTPNPAEPQPPAAERSPAAPEELSKRSPQPEVPLATPSSAAPQVARATTDNDQRVETPTTPEEAARQAAEQSKDVLPDAATKPAPSFGSTAPVRKQPASLGSGIESDVPAVRPPASASPDAPVAVVNRPLDAVRKDESRPRASIGAIVMPEPIKPSATSQSGIAASSVMPDSSRKARAGASPGSAGAKSAAPRRATAPGDGDVPLPAAKLGSVSALPGGSESGLPTAAAVRHAGSGRATDREGLRLGVPQIYQNRMSPNRAEVAVTRGGSDASEQAVERALEWLAKHQHADGHWDGDGFSLQCPADDRCSGPAKQARDDCAVTGLVLLAFLGAGHTHQQGPYAAQVAAAINWLIAQEKPNGDLRGAGRMYSQGIATLALSEALGMTGDPRLREPVTRAVRFVIAAQNPNSGGWRYNPGQYGDTSIFGWQLMAIKSASLAGVTVPNATWQKARGWLKLVSSGRHGGLACYLPGESVTPPMTAEALFCRQFLGAPPTDPTVREAADYLMDYLPDRTRQNLYYWYYGTVACFQMGGTHWQRWNAALRDPLIAQQQLDGHAAGSWDPAGDPWGVEGGRIYTTALATLCLEVYYRFLPLQSLSADAAGSPRSTTQSADRAAQP